MTMTSIVSAALTSSLALAAWTLVPLPVAAPAQAAPQAESIDYRADVADVEEALAQQGYSRVIVLDGAPPYGRAMGCRAGTDYGLSLDEDAVVVERARIGPCGGEASGRARGPHVDPERDGRDVHVRAPFAEVDVDDGGVRVRAPFVDIEIPRRR